MPARAAPQRHLANRHAGPTATSCCSWFCFTHYALYESAECTYNGKGEHRVREVVDHVNGKRYSDMDEASDTDETWPWDTHDHGTNERC